MRPWPLATGPFRFLPGRLLQIPYTGMPFRFSSILFYLDGEELLCGC